MRIFFTSDVPRH